MKLKLWPWDNEEEAFFINEPYYWFVEKGPTNYAGQKGVKVVVFIVAKKKKNNKYDPQTRIIIDKKTNNILYDSTKLEYIYNKIDILSLINHYEQSDI